VHFYAVHPLASGQARVAHRDHVHFMALTNQLSRHAADDPCAPTPNGRKLVIHLTETAIFVKTADRWPRVCPEGRCRDKALCSKRGTTDVPWRRARGLGRLDEVDPYPNSRRIALGRWTTSLTKVTCLS
jgi:hypothetical protein